MVTKERAIGSTESFYHLSLYTTRKNFENQEKQKSILTLNLNEVLIEGYEEDLHAEDSLFVLIVKKKSKVLRGSGKV